MLLRVETIIGDNTISS